MQIAILRHLVRQAMGCGGVEFELNVTLLKTKRWVRIHHSLHAKSYTCPQTFLETKTRKFNQGKTPDRYIGWRSFTLPFSFAESKP